MTDKPSEPTPKEPNDTKTDKAAKSDSTSSSSSISTLADAAEFQQLPPPEGYQERLEQNKELSTDKNVSKTSKEQKEEQEKQQNKLEEHEKVPKEEDKQQNEVKEAKNEEKSEEKTEKIPHEKIDTSVYASNITYNPQINPFEDQKTSRKSSKSEERRATFEDVRKKQKFFVKVFFLAKIFFRSGTLDAFTPSLPLFPKIFKKSQNFSIFS